MNQRGFDEGEPLGVGKADEGDTGEDGVSAAGETFQHVTGIVGRARLAEDAAFEGDFSVGADDDGRARGARGNEFGFSDG